MNPSFRSELLFFLMLFCAPSMGNRMDNSLDSNKISAENKQAEPKKSEFRAVWIATINNIDWPSNQNLSVEEQKHEFLQLLETFQKFNLNVVILQVRAASDAFYQSKTEPWSIFLTGKQGRAPKPFYDPLAWAIEMCHKRGMELHAWFNPFRVRNIGNYPLDPNSFAAKHPQFVREYDKKYFLDPGFPEVRSHVVDVIAEVAHNYDVDAVLLDDYFYPYPVEGKKFGDEKSFSAYGDEYYPKRLKAWRRENINNFVSSLHDTLQKINPKIKFGISPFGIWRNKSVDPEGSAGIRGISSFDDLYADVRKWLMKGWIDYVIPQLYWEKGNHFGDFTALVKWWGENSYGKPLYIGQALYKSTAEKNGWVQPDEINNQINYLRTNEKVRGFAFYSATNLGELSSWQVKTLWDNQLNTEAAIDDDRHATINVKPVAVNPVPQPERIAVSDERIRQEFLSSLDYNPISIREIWKSLSGIKPAVRRVGGSRILSWKANDTLSTRMIALVAFKKTGEKRYRQTVLGFSKTAEFTIPDQKWKELQEMQLLLIGRDVQSKTDQYSDFFRLKRKKVKTLSNPFRHH
jgi:uncharacterized lipoprotein YddW (UPF0748 family)